MFYFDSLIKVAATLTAEATGLLETTKKLENRLGDAKRELDQDYSDDEIEDNLWDEDFATEFAARLWEVINRVRGVCEEARADCAQRKERLLDALKDFV